MAFARRAGLASIRRTFSIIQRRPQQRSSASADWSQNSDSTALKSFENGKSCLRFHEFVLSHKFYSTDAFATLQIREETETASDMDVNPELQDVNIEEEEDTSPESNKPDEVTEKMEWKQKDAIRKIRQVLEKCDGDMEETLNQLGVQLNLNLVNKVLDKISSPSLALRFFQWAKTQPGFNHNSSSYNKLVNALGRCKDFETLQMILGEMNSVHCDYSVKTFSFATAWYDDPNMLNEVMEMFKKLVLPVRRNGYEVLIKALCEEKHINAALVALEKMASAGCAPRTLTYRPLIRVYCKNNQLDKVLEVFKMTKDSPHDPVCYNVVLSALCRKKRFQEAAQFLQTMVNRGYKPEANTYDIIIGATCNIGEIQGALELFETLKEEGIKPLFVTYFHLLDGLFRIRGFDGAHAFLIQQSGKDNLLDTANYDHLIRVCRKLGKNEEARNLLLEKRVKGLGASG